MLLFGADAAEGYDALLEDHPWIKVLRLLPPDAPPPEVFFSWHEQTFYFPQAERDVRLLQVWLGLDAPAERPPLPNDCPGALTAEELEAPEQRANGTEGQTLSRLSSQGGTK